MASPPMSVAPALSPDDEMALVCGLLRDVRAAAQDLQASLKRVLDKGSLADPKTRSQEIQLALEEAARVLERSNGQIGRLLQQIRALFHHSPQQYDWCGDQVTEIENFWGRVCAGFSDVSAGEPESAPGRIGALDEMLDEIVNRCEGLTIPRRLNAWLQNLRVGQRLDFHAAFSDELPRRDQRQRLLEELAAEPGVVEGVIDAASGSVYRTSPSAWRRRSSLLVVGAAAAAGFGLVWMATNTGKMLGLSDWPLKGEQFRYLAACYLFMVLGGVAHVGVNALARYRSSGSVGSLVLEDRLLWVHVRETAILWQILCLWVGFFTLVWTLPGATWQTYLFAGYSINSVLDVFLARFEGAAKTAEKQIEAVAR